METYFWCPVMRALQGNVKYKHHCIADCFRSLAMSIVAFSFPKLVMWLEYFFRSVYLFVCESRAISRHRGGSRLPAEPDVRLDP